MEKLSAIELLTAEELGELLRVTSNTIVRMARDGEVPAIKIFGKLRFDAAEIERWIETQKVAKKPKTRETDQ
jgi:putative molybdopterin biosynthesis protein